MEKKNDLLELEDDALNEVSGGTGGAKVFPCRSCGARFFTSEEYLLHMQTSSRCRYLYAGETPIDAVTLDPTDTFHNTDWTE